MIQHFIQDIFSLFIFSKKENKEVFFIHDIFPKIYMIKEEMDMIKINSDGFRFFELIPTNSSGISLFLKEFSQIGISIKFLKEDKHIYAEILQKKMQRYIEEKIEVETKGLVQNSFALNKQIQNLQSQIEEIQAKPLLYFSQIIVWLPESVQMKDCMRIASILHLQIFPFLFTQINAFKTYFISEKRNIRKYTYLSDISYINIFHELGISQIKEIYLGHEMISQYPIFIDLFEGENFNSVICAKSGAGKSYLAKLLMARLLLAGKKVVVIDIEGEYISFAHEWNGCVIEEDMIEAIDKTLLARDWKSFSKGMIMNLFVSEKDQQIVLGLLEQSNTIEEFTSVYMKSSFYSAVLSPIFASKKEEIQKNNCTIYHIASDNPRLAVYRILQYYIHEENRNTIIFIDEAHRFIDDEICARSIRQIAKRGRKYGIGICVITQDILDFMQNTWTKAILSNATHKILLKQEAISLPLINKCFEIEGYDEFLKQAAIGDGIYIRDKAIHQVHFDDIY